MPVMKEFVACFSCGLVKVTRKPLEHEAPAGNSAGAADSADAKKGEYDPAAVQLEPSVPGTQFRFPPVMVAAMGINTASDTIVSPPAGELQEQLLEETQIAGHKLAVKLRSPRGPSAEPSPAVNTALDEGLGGSSARARHPASACPLPAPHLIGNDTIGRPAPSWLLAAGPVSSSAFAARLPLPVETARLTGIQGFRSILQISAALADMRESSDMFCLLRSRISVANTAGCKDTSSRSCSSLVHSCKLRSALPLSSSNATHKTPYSSRAYGVVTSVVGIPLSGSCIGVMPGKSFTTQSFVNLSDKSVSIFSGSTVSSGVKLEKGSAGAVSYFMLSLQELARLQSNLEQVPDAGAVGGSLASGCGASFNSAGGVLPAFREDSRGHSLEGSPNTNASPAGLGNVAGGRCSKHPRMSYAASAPRNARASLRLPPGTRDPPHECVSLHGLPGDPDAFRPPGIDRAHSGAYPVPDNKPWRRAPGTPEALRRVTTLKSSSRGSPSMSAGPSLSSAMPRAVSVGNLSMLTQAIAMEGATADKRRRGSATIASGSSGSVYLLRDSRLAHLLEASQYMGSFKQHGRAHAPVSGTPMRHALRE